MRVFKTKDNKRDTLIELAIKNSISHKIKQMADPEEKRVLVAEHNPTHYQFGTTLTPWKPWLTYEENMQ